MANFDLASYDTVHDRLKRFWLDHPDGAIITDMVSVTPDHKSVIIRAQVWFDKADTMPAGVGLAQENQGGNGPNGASWVEVADTSAVGRALANCGYSGNLRPSREEMQKPSRAPVTTPSSRFTDSGQTNSRVADARPHPNTTDRDDAPSYGGR